MKWAVLLLLALSAAGVAAKNVPKDDYKDAVLLSVRSVSNGMSCSGSTNGKEEDDGNFHANSNANCHERMVHHYTLKIEAQTFVVTPATTVSSIATLGFSKAFKGDSVLANQIPGAHVSVRSDSSGFYVKVGKKESKFRVVEAE